MRMSFKIKIVKDDKLWRKMYRNLNRAGSQSAVDVGFWGNRHPSGPLVAQIAAWNEEGHMTGWGGYSPPRPFIRIGFMGEVSRGKMKKYIPYVNRIAMGQMTWAALNALIAKDMKAIMQKRILEWKSPRNSPFTIALKGFDDPLIETGTMYDRVKTRVVRKK